MTHTPLAPLDISVVIPVWNEQNSLVELHRQLSEVLNRLARPYEIIWVDDGSTDHTPAICRQQAQADPRVVVVELRRNFGKATALQAGFQVARGNVVITLDGDLQDDPADIPDFLQALESGADVVSGWKQTRRDPPARLLQSRVFNFFTSLFTGQPLRDFNCGFKAYRQPVVASLNLLWRTPPLHSGSGARQRLPRRGNTRPAPPSQSRPLTLRSPTVMARRIQSADRIIPGLN